MKRRHFILSLAVLLASTALKVKAKIISGGMPWRAHAVRPPQPVIPGEWHFFNNNEVILMDSLVDLIIPPDELSIGAKEAGCTLFIDRQLSGDFGKATTVYRLGPVVEGLPQQGPQFKDTPAERYRLGLAAIGNVAKKQYQKEFHQLEEEQQIEMLQSIENGTLALPGLNGQAFFAMLIQNVREGFFADPLYGGNKDMAGWKMLGFPGARYDYREEIKLRGKDLNLVPIRMIGTQKDA